MPDTQRPLIAGNWKMNLPPSRVAGYAADFLERTAAFAAEVELLVCPSYVALPAALTAFADAPVAVGAQNMHQESKGAFTGAVAGEMLVDLGIEWVILGHSERRHVFGEDDELILAKLERALELDLRPILCVGELLEQREAGETAAVLEQQLHPALNALEPAALARLTLAYEPVWAIGTGKTATPQTAQQAHEQIRHLFKPHLPAQAVIRILYGGSVKPHNAAELLAQPDIDGVLVGGASLEPQSFAAIARAGVEHP